LQFAGLDRRSTTTWFCEKSEDDPVRLLAYNGKERKEKEEKEKERKNNRKKQ